MGITPKGQRRPPPICPDDVAALPRLMRREAVVRCVAEGGRLRISWRTISGRTHALLVGSFRHQFPRHGDACYMSVTEVKGGVWSVPLRHEQRLAEWVSARFHQDCELGEMPWD